MSPITEESAKLLVENLTLAMAQCQEQRLQLMAFEEALQKHAPAAYEAYADQLRKLREHNDATRILVGMERLKDLLQK